MLYLLFFLISLSLVILLRAVRLVGCQSIAYRQLVWSASHRNIRRAKPATYLAWHLPVHTCSICVISANLRISPLRVLGVSRTTLNGIFLTCTLAVRK